MKKFLLLLFIISSYLYADLNYSDDKQLDTFIKKIKKEDHADTLVKKMAIYINKTYPNYNENIEVFDFAIDNIGKRHLSRLSAKIRFYLSGPKNLEIFMLIKLKKQGLDNDSIANILLSASGSYAPLGKRATKVLKDEGFNKRVISIIDNYTLLSTGSKNLKIKDLIVMLNNGVDSKDIVDLIIESDIPDKKYTKKSIKYLLSLGLTKNILSTLVYKKLLLTGSASYQIYHIFVDLKRNNLDENKILEKIYATNWFYKDYSPREEKILVKYGLSENILKAMKDATKKYKINTSKSTQMYVKKIDEQNNRKKQNFAKMKNTLMNKAATNNAVLNGLNENVEDTTQTKVVKKVGNCAAQMLGLKACDKVPFPLNLGCSALVKNKFPCGI